MEIQTTFGGNDVTMGPQFTGLNRCPHCAIAAPHFIRAWASAGFVLHRDDSASRMWGCYICVTCGSVVTLRGAPNDKSEWVEIDGVFPPAPQAHEDLPPAARTYLQQAFETLHAPDAAAMLAGSAVDAMLKEKELTEGNLYTRIHKALEDNILTQGMADWAHWVRLGSNRPRHADKDTPHVTPEEAKQSVAFAEALGNFLFVLTKQIDRGIEAAETAAKPPE